MTLPNAHKGVQKLFISQILNIIGVALLLFAIVSLGAALGFSVYGDTAAGSGFAIGSLVTLCGSIILPILAVILTLVGFKQASIDEPDRMAKAFWCGIFTLIFSALSALFQALDWGGFVVFDVLGEIAEICMFIFGIMGVSEVTQNISRQDVADMGPKIMVIVIIASVIAIIAGIVGNTIGGVAATISLVLMLVAYVVYLVFLGRATSALANG